MKIDSRLLRGSVAAGILAVFACFAWPGLTTFFDADDVMNLRSAWVIPVSVLLRRCFDLSISGYRPMGQLFYHVMFAVAGFRPFWFHAACFVMLLVNVYLLYRVTRVLTGSVEIALLAALVGCFHSRFDALYASSGTVYDLLCYGFFTATLLCYPALRKRRLAGSASLVLMQWCALDCKEMAATLPVLLLAYELLYGGPVRPFQIRRWIGLTVVILFTAAFMLPKLMLASPLTQSYRPRYTLTQLVSTWEYYSGQLVYGLRPMPGWELVAIITTMCVTATLLRSKPLIFCCIWIAVTPLPVCFVDQRGFYVWYIPLAGWAMYVAALLGRFATSNRRWVVVYTAAALFLCVAHSVDRKHVFPHDSGKNELIRNTVAQFTAIFPKIRPDARVLFLDDPFDPDEWTLSSLLQLYYRYPELDIERVRLPQQLEGIPGITFDYILDYRDQRIKLTGCIALIPG